MRRHFFYHGYRTARNPDEFVAELHDVIDSVMERATSYPAFRRTAEELESRIPFLTGELTLRTDRRNVQ